MPRVEELLVREVERLEKGVDLAAKRGVAGAARVEKRRPVACVDFSEGEEDGFGGGQRHASPGGPDPPAGPSAR